MTVFQPHGDPDPAASPLPAARPRRLRSRLQYCLNLFLAAALIFVVARVVGWQKIARALAGTDLSCVAMAWLLGLAARSGEAFQLSLVMRRMELAIRPFHVLLASSMGAMYSLVIPGDLTSSVVKWAYLASATGKRSAVLNAIVYNRFMAIGPWILGGLAALTIHNPWQSALLPLGALALGATMAACMLILYHPRLGPRTDRLVMTILRRLLPCHVSRRIEDALQSLTTLREFPIRLHFLVFSVGCVNAMVLFGAFAAMSSAVGIRVSWVLLAWVWCVLMLMRQLPISIHGLGVREAALVVLLGRFGVADNAAFALGTLVFLDIVLFAVLGAGMQVVLGLTRARSTSTPLEKSKDAAAAPIRKAA